jgi:hydroxymethylbilane synthase
MIRHELSLSEFTPAVGQGSIAIESASGLDPVLKQEIISACHDAETGFRLEAERSYLRILEGGCSIPVFALASVSDERLALEGGIVSLDGKVRIVKKVEGAKENAIQLGEELAKLVLEAGGKEILTEIKTALKK